MPGIFLDRGELERLIDAQADYQPQYGDMHGYDDEYRRHGQHRKHRGGFRDELFD